MKRCIVILIATTGMAWADDQATAQPPSVRAGTNLELTVYLVEGHAQLQSSGKDEVPQELASTLQQLRGVFAYKSYKLMEAVTLRGRNNSGAEVSGGLPDYSQYDFKYLAARITGETPHMVHLDRLRLEITRRHSDRIDPVALVATDLDVKDGQKTVVGKSAVNGVDALFLVIVPKVVE